MRILDDEITVGTLVSIIAALLRLPIIQDPDFVFIKQSDHDLLPLRVISLKVNMRLCWNKLKYYITVLRDVGTKEYLKGYTT